MSSNSSNEPEAEANSHPEQVMGVVAGATAWVGAIACVAMMVLVFVNVILRFSWRSIPGTLEITESFMVVIAVMMLAYTQIKRGHVNVEFVINYLRPKPRQSLELFTLILALGFTVFLAWQSWEVAVLALSIKDASGTPPYVPYYPAKLILAIGISVLCFQLIVDVWQAITKLFVTKAKNAPS